MHFYASRRLQKLFVSYSNRGIYIYNVLGDQKEIVIHYSDYYTRSFRNEFSHWYPPLLLNIIYTHFLIL